jgi:hypothetical protein
MLVLLSTLSGSGAGVVLIQPDLAFVVTALAFVAEISLAVVLSWRSTSETNFALAVPSIRHVRADGCLPTFESASVPRLVLLSQPRR